MTMIHPNGVIIRSITSSVERTAGQLIELLKLKGVKIYAVIDQQLELTAVGKTIPPMLLIVFGNPQVGGALLPLIPEAGLDLPLKILVWENEKQEVHLAYNSSLFLENRYHLGNDASHLVDLDNLVNILSGNL